MAEKIRHKQGSKTGADTLEFDEFELNSTMQEFLSEETKESGKGIWNISTISGMVMLFIAFTFLLQTIGLPTGGFLSGLTELIQSNVLPLIGGFFITLIGFGYLVGDRKKVRKAKKEKRKKEKQKETYSDIHGGEESDFSRHAGLKNDLDGGRTSSEDMDFSAYGYRHARRLMKSRTNKKWAGVCGGLAKYFGISATVVRFIFVAAFFMGYGTSLLIYFGLALAMPKEPIDMLDDYEF